MKPYGLPRLDDASAPDCADAHRFARPSRAYNVPGKGGETSAFRSLRGGAARAIRRAYKRAERGAAKRALARGDD
jgi:hypothetical protein